MIEATITSDDGKRKVVFDAEYWFASAIPEWIVGLAKGGWGNCLFADGVAIFMSDHDYHIADMMAHILSQKKYKGFECTINAEQAKKFISAHLRPNIIDIVNKIEKSAGRTPCPNMGTRCAACNVIIPKGSSIEHDENGTPLCNKCYNEIFRTCEKCGAMVDVESMYHIKDIDQMWCEKCRVLGKPTHSNATTAIVTSHI